MRIRVRDNSQHCPYADSASGEYSFSTVYNFVDGSDSVTLEHYCSRGYDYCHIWGTFERCQDCSDWNSESGCQAQPEVIPAQDAWKYITTAIGNPDYSVSAQSGEDEVIIWPGRGHRAGYCSICDYDYGS